jgi:malate synthase
MEDAATAEICRMQVWQWIDHRAKLDDGQIVTAALVRDLVDQELARVRTEIGAARFDVGRFAQARRLFEDLALSATAEEFLTIPAYRALLTDEGAL